MIKLCDFIGGMLADVSEARQIADRNSVLLSQSYHADEFMKGMPVPHYTIDEAEITVPVMVVGVQPDSGQYAAMEKGVESSIKCKLPELLYVVLKNYYLKKQRDRKAQSQQEQQAQLFPTPNNTSGVPHNAVQDGEKIPDYIKNRYRQSAETITAQFQSPMKRYLHTANFEVVKLLDVKDFFCDLLQNFLQQEFSGYDEASVPWLDQAQLKTICNELGTRMFFEFKQIAQNSRGVMVEPTTGKMNEYGSRDCMTYIRLKVREQDVDCVVEGDEKGGRRFLSLN